MLLILATAGIHARIASVDLAANDLLTSFTDPNGPSWLQPIPTDTPAPTVLASHLPGATPEPTPTPSPTPAPTATPNWMADGKLNLLVIGSDAGPDRWMLRTDTMIVATVDLATRRAALYGIPRNIENVPLPAETAGLFACRCYPDMLNSLYVYAAGHPAQFPGGNTRGFRALEGAIGTLLGVKVDGSVVVSLNGFVKLIDALGGLDMYVTERVVDSHYPKPDGSGNIAIDIEPGQHHFNGITALEYARSRHQDSDYGRMRRQQQVLLALRKDINPCSLLPRAEEIMGALKDTLWTDMPVAALPDLLGLAAHVNPATVASYEFVPPVYPEYLDAASIAKIRSVVSHGLDKVPTPTDTGGGGGGSGFSC